MTVSQLGHGNCFILAFKFLKYSYKAKEKNPVLVEDRDDFHN